MTRKQLTELVKEELRGWSPQIGHTKGLTTQTLNKILMKIASGDDYEPDNEVEEKLKEALNQLEEEKPGLWANIRAKRARGEKPSHGNSKAHKDAVKAGKKINAMSEDKSDAIRWFGNLKYYYQKAFTELKGEDRETYKQLAKDFFSKLEIDQKVRAVGLSEEDANEGMMFYKDQLNNLVPKGMGADKILDDLIKVMNKFYADHDLDIKVLGEEQAEWPEEVPSRYDGEYIFKLIKTSSDRAKYAVIDIETGEEEGTLVFNRPEQLHTYAQDLIKPQGGRQSSQF